MFTLSPAPPTPRSPAHPYALWTQTSEEPLFSTRCSHLMQHLPARATAVPLLCALAFVASSCEQPISVTPDSKTQETIADVRWSWRDVGIATAMPAWQMGCERFEYFQGLTSCNELELPERNLMWSHMTRPNFRSTDTHCGQLRQLLSQMLMSGGASWGDDDRFWGMSQGTAYLWLDDDVVNGTSMFESQVTGIHEPWHAQFGHLSPSTTEAQIDSAGADCYNYYSNPPQIPPWN